MFTLCARQVGHIASRVLVPGARGRVQAAFSRAAYLVTQPADLVWLTAESTALHARGVHVEGAFPQLAPGAIIYVDGSRLSVARDVEVELGSASVWTAAFSPPPAAPVLDEMPARVGAWLRAASGDREARGLARLLPRISSLAAGELSVEPETDPVLAFAWPTILAVANDCLAQDLASVWRTARALIGLGEGLTPSGDDFVGGLLFGVQAIDRLLPGFTDPAASQRDELIEWARQHTHLISFTVLQDLAHGEAVEPLHALVNAVLDGWAADRAPELSARLTEIGHSTGWDLLAGTLTAMLATFRLHR